MQDASSSDKLAQKYDAAAPGWADKMRLLGYFDAYLGFLSIGSADDLGRNGLDVGCGTGAFAEARAVIQPEGKVTLLEPSGKMLKQAEGALALRGVTTQTARSRLEDFPPAQPFDCVLAAHVLEHCDNPTDALRHMRRQAAPAAKLWLVVSKPHWCNAIIWLQWRHRSYRPQQVAKMLKEAGWVLEAEHSFPTGPPSRTSRGYLARAV
ncbi:class I SAM-dependent methyltransferase [Ruegeria atlantica]|uniref:Bifunctional 3-demethylubiquinone-9 3-methyltransferase/ 2-octaprenyl-6-hydroxy phenol methylase n=1 Tax=Ruegeria atlantica TaxID=81569 RepID=A0A0P1E635_9RHOB|nr:class I SAM-dependent methyltransferase [Ruegeria atlantica]CUH43138.1 bifunctional 3-demethylubiquinone-9 3-methyltransferase/ 2-octaprenyl-6-hydroxy phenol methylase [Ruegeria atlantica]